MKQKLYVLILLSLPLVAYQNCGNHNFSYRNAQNKSSGQDSTLIATDLAPVSGSEDVLNDTSSDSNGNISSANDPDQKGDDSSASTDPTTQPTTTINGNSDHSNEQAQDNSNPGNDVSASNDETGSGTAASNDPGNSNSSHPGDSNSSDHSNPASGSSSADSTSDDQEGVHNYICILDGHGSSERVGVVAEKLSKVGSTLKTACMSKSACLDIISKKLAVKKADFRGYCKNESKQIFVLSDEKVASLVDLIN